MQKGIKFRIYPNRDQKNLINQTFGCCRLIYNKGLDMRSEAYSNGHKIGYPQTSAMLTELKKQYTIVIVTHNIAQARRISDYAAFLFGGRLVEWGKSEDLFGCPKEEETRAFLAGIYG